MTFVGLDLHKRYITACAIDGDGTPLGDIRRLSVALDGVLQCLADLPQPVSVALESTLYWSWLHDHLVRTGHRVQVAHAFRATLKLAPGPVGQHYRHLVRAKGKSTAATAAARKLCCYIYWMLKEGWSYEEWLQQHEQQHGPSRWSEVRPAQLLGTVA